MKKILFLLVTLSVFAACNQEPAQEEWPPLSLLDQTGLPITIMAPDSAVVKMSDMGILKDITVKGGDNYYLQIYAASATTNDLAKIKSDKLSEVKSNRYFSKIVREEEAGFIYETKIDSTNINYGFRYALVKGDMEYIFQTGLIGTYELEEIERMYQAVQPVKR
jgi:hypothetical protein